MVKYTERTIKMVEYHDLDAAISEFYGTEFCSIANEEWHNYSCYMLNVEKEELGDHDLGIVIRAICGQYELCSVRILLVHMANLGIIESGDYLINVFW